MNMPVPTPPEPEIPAELIADIEAAGRKAQQTNGEVLTMIHGLHQAWHALGGCEELHERWQELVDLSAGYEQLDELALAGYWDQARTWLDESVNLTSHWLWAHDLPYVEILFLHPVSGRPLTVSVNASAPPV